MQVVSNCCLYGEVISIKSKNIKYRDIIKIFKDIRKEQIFLFIICALAVIADVLLVYQVQDLIDSINTKSEFTNLAIIFLKIIFWGTLSFVINLVQIRKWHYFGNKLINSMRCKMYKSMLKKPLTFFDNYTTGDLASKILNDGSSIAESAGIEILMLILNIFKILIILTILFLFNIKLSIIVLIILPLFFFLLVKMSANMRVAYEKERTAFGYIQQLLIENIKGIINIKTLQKEDYFIKNFNEAVNKKYYSNLKKVINLQVTIGAINEIMTIFLPVIILIVGAKFAYDGELTIGTLIAFYTYLSKLVEPITNLADYYLGSRQALGAVDRIYDFIFDNDQSNSLNSINTTITNVDVNIKKFEFDNKKILGELNFKLSKGDRIFIQGESGKGKSTLLKLLMNFYKIKDGNILINNTNLSTIDNSLYNHMLMMTQEPFIFEGTIKENLFLGDNFSYNDLNYIAEITCIDTLIKEKGLDYKLTENGGNLSGGQKQRINLARILLRKPSVLLLDEATSALDPKTEKLLINNLNNYLNKYNITLIAVSHNKEISTICNKCLVIK